MYEIEEIDGLVFIVGETEKTHWQVGVGTDDRDFWKSIYAFMDTIKEKAREREEGKVKFWLI